jgi:hypothetical protein
VPCYAVSTVIIYVTATEVRFGPRDSDKEGTTFCRRLCNFTLIKHLNFEELNLKQQASQNHMSHISSRYRESTVS